MLTGHPDTDRRLAYAGGATYGNQIVATIVERAEALHRHRPELLDGIAQRFTAAGCPYQARRTTALAALAL